MTAAVGRPVGAVIFDLDGLLIDSEPLWHRAEIQSFAEVGVELGSRDCLRTIGMRCDAVVQLWLRERGWNVGKHPPDEVERRIVERVIDLVRAEGRSRPGVSELLAMLGQREVPLAVASSSPMSVISATLETLGIESQFIAVHSAELEERGKPDPAVYLSAAAALGVDPADCLALEDSLPGLRAALKAGMRCLMVPDRSCLAAPELAEATAVLDTLEHFDEHLWTLLTFEQTVTTGDPG